MKKPGRVTKLVFSCIISVLVAPILVAILAKYFLFIMKLFGADTDNA